MEPHTGFIVAAFAVTGLVLAGVIAANLLDYRVQLRTLAELSARLDRREIGDGGARKPLPGGRDDDA